MSISENVKKARRRAQQERLVNEDFPWLWAVRNRWRFGYRILVVANADRHLERFLAQPTNHPDASEVWIRYGFEDIEMGIEQVTALSAHACWGDAILECLDRGESLMNIVLIDPPGLGLGEGMTVYRPRRGARELNPFILKAMQSS